jgi:outer membrane cobalamin receptor
MIKASLIRALLFSVTVISLGSLTRAATIEGTVFDPSGQAVPGARVSLTRSLVVIGERETDSRGAYKFEGLQEGIYQVAASSRGLAGPLIDVDLHEAPGKRQDIHLEISAIESQVVVSASLGGALAPQIGSSVSMVDRQEIDDRAGQSVLEMLRGTPGIEINQTGRHGGLTSVYIRGGESNYNAVMVDGIPMNQFGGAFYLEPLPADGVERIEVSRGPASALYGSNAVTGVINVISRRGEGPPKFSALMEGGSNSTRRFATDGSGLTKGFSWSYSLSRLDTDGVVVNDSYRNQSAFLNLGFYQSSRRQVDFHFFGDATNAGMPGPYGSDPYHRFMGIETMSWGKQNLFGYQLGYTEQLARRVRQVTTVSLSTNYYFSNSQYYGPYSSDSLRGGFNTRSEITVSNKDSVAVGIEYGREQIRDTYLTDSQGTSFLLPRTSFAVFAENRWSPSDRIYFIAGVRLDDLRTHSLPAGPPSFWGPSRPFIPESSIVKVNPRISIAYIASEGNPGSILGKTRLHGTFGTGIRPPGSFELSSSDNPLLKPEKSVSFDAGVEQGFWGSRAILDVTYFLNRFKDQIVTVGGSLSNLSSYTSDNLNNSRAQGLEVTFRANPLPSLQLGGVYTFLDSSILALDGSSQAKPPFQVGQPLLRRPRHSGSYNATWRYKKLTLSTNAYFRGEILDTEPNWGTPFIANPGYTRADAGFSYQLPRGVEVYGRLNNFLNQKYEEVLGYPSLHLNFMAGMRFRFPSE